MRFSITTGAAGHANGPREFAELAALAERSGWDGFFLEDYLVYQGDEDMPTYDPWVCLSAIAMSTERIRLGTTVTPVPRRRPWKLAAEAVSVDRLSGGRLILGVGSGDPNEPGVRRTGEPTTARTLAERLDEGLEIIAALWTGEPVQHTGNHFRVDGLRLSAVPVQQPRIPIWVGGDLLVPAVRRRMARWDGSCGYKGPPSGEHPPITPEDIRGIRALAEGVQGTANGFDVKISGSRDPEVLRALAEAGATWWGQWVPPDDPARIRDVIVAGPPALR